MELRIHRHGRVDSTSERAFVALADGTGRDGDVHVASGQTAGRGRRGASWHSPEGEGLYLSVVLAPEGAGTVAEAISLAGALAVRDALLELGVERMELSWPNDLLVGGGKLAGVLVESRGFDPVRPRMVLGIGVNVLQRAFPPELTRERAVTSLALLGVPTTPEALLETLLPHLAARLQAGRADPESIAAAYAKAGGLVGRRVRVDDGAAGLEGVLRAITLASGVTVEGPDGGRSSVPLGHVRGLIASP